MNDRQSPPNIVFILTDQMRGDCLGALGHPVVKTPNLDKLAGQGTIFTSAFSACPSCIAARASIFTGQRPTTHGRLGYRDQVPWRYDDTLAEVFLRSGYQTHCVGKTHFFPQRLPMGFETQDSYEALQDFGNGYVNDYFEWLKERTDIQERDSGLGSNSWVGGESCLPEELHNNSWVATRGIDFLNRRDRDRPFFLNLSFHRPHAPLDPPKEYRAMYEDCPIPPAPVGDWAARHDVPVVDINAWHGGLSDEELAESRRSYYALITHIDAQIGRFRAALEAMNAGPTWFLFTSDHGEMLGDHNLFRKTYAYQGSAGIPMIVTPPEKPGQRICGAPISHQDIMPTLLEAAGLEAPKHVEGRSMIPLLNGSPVTELLFRGDPVLAVDPKRPVVTSRSDPRPQDGRCPVEANWREYVHGEHSPCYHPDTGMQFLTDGKEKYIWYTLTGEEQFFDLTADPDELYNLAADPASKNRLCLWRSRMVAELAGRTDDGLSDGKHLIAGKTLPSVRPSLLENE